MGSDRSALQTTERVLVTAERIVFAAVALLLFFAAAGLAWRSVAPLLLLFSGNNTSLIDTAAAFLNIILLILMVAEIAYTVTASIRGGVLSPEPFLIVGLIAVIRRILVITVQEVQAPVATTAGIASSSVEVAILTAVVIAFVFAIYLLRARSRN